MSVNRVILLGRIGSDPEVKYLEGGVCVAKFSLATSEVYKDKSGEKKEDTTWHNIIVWRKLAEIVEKFVKKGDMLYIEGKIKNSSYEKDGITHYRTDIVAENLKMLGGKKDESPKSESNELVNKPVESELTEDKGDEGLPF